MWFVVGGLLLVVRCWWFVVGGSLLVVDLSLRDSWVLNAACAELVTLKNRVGKFWIQPIKEDPTHGSV